MKTLKGLIMLIQFFTSIPIPYSVPMDKEHVEKAVKMFPLLGLLQGCVYALLVYLLSNWTPFSTLAIAFLLWMTFILLTGGLHLDGWMDASDAYFSYRDVPRRLDIMKDPRVGAFGVLSVVVLLSTRFLFVYETLELITDITYVFLILIPFLGRTVMGSILIQVKAAKEDGLGSLFKNAATKTTLMIYPVYLVAVMILVMMFVKSAIMIVFVLYAVAIFLRLLFGRKIVKWFGGITGDVLGASVEGVEVGLWLTVWLWHYFAMG